MNATAFLSDLMDAWNSQDMERLMSFYHPDFQGEDIAEEKQANGLPQVSQMIRYIFKAFPDLHTEVLQYGVDQDTIFFFWEASGRQGGRLMNIPPTGKKVKFTGATMVTLRDGKIISSRRLWDAAAVLRQIGLLPELTSATYR